jgi:MFS transporter, DHA1 family, multidrug resistance protein
VSRTPAPVGALVVAVLAALSAMGALSIDMYLPALPAIAADLGASPSAVQWSLSPFFVGFALGQLVWEPLSDRVGRRGPVAAGLMLYVVASVGCALATAAPALALLRLVQALGASAGPVLARAMAADVSEGEGAAHLLSTLVVAMGIAPLLAPAVGAGMLGLAGWRSIFWLLAAVGVTILAASRLMGETLPATARRGSASVTRDYATLLGQRAFVAPALAAAAVYGGMFAYTSPRRRSCSSPGPGSRRASSPSSSAATSPGSSARRRSTVGWSHASVRAA